MLRIFPDRVELGFWRIWYNYLVIFVTGIVIGVLLTVVGFTTDWFQVLWSMTPWG